MRKKVLKRGLALSALMAVLITGNAYASTIISPLYVDGEAKNGTYYTDTNIGRNDGGSVANSVQVINAVYGPAIHSTSNIFNLDGKNINIESHVLPNYDDYWQTCLKVENQGTVLSIGSLGKTDELVIAKTNADHRGLLSFDSSHTVCVDYGGELNLDAKNITITNDTSNAVFVTDGALLKIGQLGETQSLNIQSEADTCVGMFIGYNYPNYQTAKALVDANSISVKGGTYGIFLTHKSELEMGLKEKTDNVLITGSDAGLVVFGSKVDLKGENIHIKADEEAGIYVDSDSWYNAAGDVNVEGNLCIDAPLAIELYGNSKLNINSADKDYSCYINGDIIAESQNNDIYIGKGVFNGAAFGAEGNDDSIVLGHANLGFAEGGVWNMTAESNVDSIYFTTGGMVDMTADGYNTALSNLNANYDNTSVNNVKKLVVNNSITGAGTIKMDIDWQSNLGQKHETDGSDYLYANGNENSGSLELAFASEKANLLDMNIGDKLYFAHVADNGLTFTSGELASFKAANASKLHNEEFYLDASSGSENTESGGGNGGGGQITEPGDPNIPIPIAYSLQATPSSLDTTENEDSTSVNEPAEDGQEAQANGVDWYIGRRESEQTEDNENENPLMAGDFVRAAYTFATEMDRMNKRIGEARFLDDGAEKGLWVRYRHARTGMDQSFKSNSNMFQISYDAEINAKDGKHFRGVAVDFTDSDTNLHEIKGRGEQKRYAMSLYDTWIGDKGHYYDLVLRGGRINSDFDMYDSANTLITNEYHQWFGSISGEYGRKLNSAHDWYVEPQAQLQLTRIGSTDHVTNHGVRMEQDASTSLVGRLGFRLGREVNNDNIAKRANYYLKADVMHEFCGEMDYKVTGADGSLQKKYDAQNTWYDVGIGADITLNKASTLWLDLERTFGGDYDRTWQVNAGVRFSF